MIIIGYQWRRLQSDRDEYDNDGDVAANDGIALTNIISHTVSKRYTIVRLIFNIHLKYAADEKHFIGDGDNADASARGFVSERECR